MVQLSIERGGVPAVVRTDFSDGRRWAKVCEVIVEGEMENSADSDHPPSFEFHDKLIFDNASPEELIAAVPVGSGHSVFFVVDGATMRDSELAITAVDIRGGRTVRALPEHCYAIWSALFTGTSDFDAILNIAAQDQSGLYR